MEDGDQNGFFESLFGKPESSYNDGERAIAKLDEGWAKAALFFRTGKHFGHEARTFQPRGLLSIHGVLAVYKARFGKGDTLSLLIAVSLCAQENVPLPTWLAMAYRDALDSFLQPGTNSSLDDIFHSETLPTATPQKAASARQDWLLGGTIWSKVWETVIEDESIMTFDTALVATLKAGNFGVEKTKARELFLMIDKNQSELIQSKTLSRFLALRRKGVTSK